MSASSHPNIRLYCEQPLCEAQEVQLEGKPQHYLMHVMRRKVGDAIALFNAEHGEWRAEITETSKKHIRLQLQSQLRKPEPCPQATLICAPIKSGHFEVMIQKATELGVSHIRPVKTQHTVIARTNEDRLRQIAIEAAEQCERVDIPVMHPITPFNQLLADWDHTIPIFAGDESGAGNAASDALPARLNTAHPSPWAVMVGPEGGFSAAELQKLRDHPAAHMLTLGPRILRADTAAITLLTLTMARFGDWEHKPAFRSEG